MITYVSESADSKSIKILGCFLDREQSSQNKSKAFYLNLFISSIGICKVCSLFEPKCLIDDIFKSNIQIKAKHGIFRKYTYPFNHKKAKKTQRKINTERGQLFLYEKLFMQFPEYLDFANKSFKFLMHKEGYLLFSIRFYVAIMVFVS